MGYVETRTFYVAHLASRNLILGQPALESVRAVTPAGQNPVTIQGNGMPRFSLTLSRGSYYHFLWNSKEDRTSVVTYAATEIFGTPNKSLRNKVKYLFSRRKEGYAIFDK